MIQQYKIRLWVSYSSGHSQMNNLAGLLYGIFQPVGAGQTVPDNSKSIPMLFSCTIFCFYEYSPSHHCCVLNQHTFYQSFAMSHYGTSCFFNNFVLYLFQIFQCNSEGRYFYCSLEQLATDASASHRMLQFSVVIGFPLQVPRGEDLSGIQCTQYITNILKIVLNTLHPAGIFMFFNL